MKTKKTSRSGALKPRKKYSNWSTGEGGSGMFVDLGTTGDYSDVTTHETYNAGGTPYSESSGGWSPSDTANLINTGINSTASVLNSIFGHNYQWQSEALNTMYQQEKRTNTILWVAIGLILALGVVLVIRKTK